MKNWLSGLTLILTILHTNSCYQVNSQQEITEINNADGYQLSFEPKGSVFSSFKLVFIPSNSKFVPSREQQKRAIEFVASELGHFTIGSTETEHPTFQNSGEGFESVTCNLCGELMKVEGWHEHMNKAYASNFEQLDIIPNCCNKETSLNDLIYKMDSGFAKYVISVNGLNPFDDEHITKRLTERLEQICGTELRTLFVKF